MKQKQIIKAYEAAKERYASLGVSTDRAMSKLSKIPISLHCWQGDDVGGFEKPNAELAGGGIQATGNYPGKARTIEQLRQDIDNALDMIPGKHRLNLHACYLDNGGKFVERNRIGIEHFQSWVDWAKQRKIGLDFNPTYFSHPKAADGFTLSHSDKGIRNFWIEHGIACRKIAEQMGKQLGSTVITNFWVPDGYKDIPVDRKSPRQRLRDSLDRIFKYKINPKYNRDSVESKLFGIGSESYVVGSHEFYMGYAISRNKLLCLDAGHFHPTEVISDKISSVMTYLEEILLHVSRPVRWDSDHVVILNDELLAISQEIVRGGFIGRVHIGLDFFDASINRIAAWVIGVRCMIKSLLTALLEPILLLRRSELEGDFTRRLAMLEELKTMPFGAVWNYYCLKNDVPQEADWMEEIRRYESEVLSKRL
ncbi:MAG: L-rhamnose isomerase [Sedimentisphaerales bacterium]